MPTCHPVARRRGSRKRKLRAFLTPGGVADAVLHQGIDEVFTCCLTDAIIVGTVQRPLTPRLQQRYAYTADDVDTFKSTLRGSSLCGKLLKRPIGRRTPLLGLLHVMLALACILNAAQRLPVTCPMTGEEAVQP
jgi:hypothetical protein